MHYFFVEFKTYSNSICNSFLFNVSSLCLVQRASTCFFKTVQSYIFAGFLGFFILGFHPYITNTIWYKNPFYLDEGKGSESFLYINTPESFYYISSPERFVYSIFSRSEILRGEGKSNTLKLPFTYSKSEIKTIVSDNTTGGFGPLFSGVFILSIFGFIYIFYSKQTRDIKYGILLFLFVILLSSMFFPVSSYARFITPFWIFPCLIAIYLACEEKRLSTFLSFCIFTAIIVNNFLITLNYISFNLKGTKEVRNELEKIKKLSYENDIQVDFGLFRSNRVRFKEAGVRFSEYSAEQCSFDKTRVLTEYIPESKITLCYKSKI